MTIGTLPIAELLFQFVRSATVVQFALRLRKSCSFRHICLLGCWLGVHALGGMFLSSDTSPAFVLLLACGILLLFAAKVTQGEKRHTEQLATEPYDSIPVGAITAFQTESWFWLVHRQRFLPGKGAMRTFAPIFATTFASTFAVTIAACVSFAGGQPRDAPAITPLIELQSGPLTPGLVIDESPRPIHQIRLVVDASLRRGALILDGNRPEFNEFGELVGGIQTPEVRAKGKAALILELGCTIELVKEGPAKWFLYRISGPDIGTPLRVATRGSIAGGGPARLVVLGPGDETRAVVNCTRYGLVVP